MRKRVIIDSPYYSVQSLNRANENGLTNNLNNRNFKQTMTLEEQKKQFACERRGVTKECIEKSMSKLVLHDIEEDYEAIYRDGWRPDPEDFFRDIPVGNCMQMCPSMEVLERETQRRLHHYEIEPGSMPPKAKSRGAVKQFTRSCVGSDIPSAGVLRPWSVLKQTLHYLLLKIATKEDNWLLICDFVYDRLCAIRQDMIIQRIQGKRCIEILEGSVRFLVYSLFRLTHTMRDDQKSNKIQHKIVETNGGPLKGLTNYEMEIVREMKLTLQNLRDCLNSLLEHYENFVPNSHFRPLFESINLIFNLPYLRGGYLKQTSYLKDYKLSCQNTHFKLVHDIYIQHSSGFHLSALKNVPKLASEPLLLFAYASVIAPLQVYLVILLKKAYASSKSSLDYFASMICPDWLEEDKTKRIQFARFMAIQNGVYDCERNICDYNLSRITIEEYKLINPSDHDSETKLFAMHMMCGRKWSFFREVYLKYGEEYLLDPSQPKKQEVKATE